MTARLFVRPARQDHIVMADLLAPGGGAHPREGGPLIGGVVVDATLAEARPQFAESASAVGVPVLVDPDTFYLQGLVAADDPFSQLPYGNLAGLAPGDIDLDQFIDTVIEFQVDHGATTLVVPYFHVSDLESEWTRLNLELPTRTALRCERLGVQLPALAVFSGSRKTIPSERGITHTEAFAERAADSGISALAVCLSPAGKPVDSYDGVTRVARVIRRAMDRSDTPVIAWRQGVYGPALVALGAAGYECGLGVGEMTDVASMQGRRKPQSRQKEGQGGGSPKMVYFSQFERSVKADVAKALLTDQRVQGELICDRPGCCSSVAETLRDPRPHAVRTRTGELEEMNAQPASWKVQHLVRKLETSLGTAKRANEVLEGTGLNYRLPVNNMQAIIEMLRFEGGIGS